MEEEFNLQEELEEIEVQETMPKVENKKEQCEKCHGTGIVKEADGSCHTCWDCLNSGRLNQHSNKLPENTRFKL